MFGTQALVLYRPLHTSAMHGYIIKRYWINQRPASQLEVISVAVDQSNLPLTVDRDACIVQEVINLHMSLYLYLFKA